MSVGRPRSDRRSPSGSVRSSASWESPSTEEAVAASSRRWAWSLWRPTSPAMTFRPPSWRSDLEREIDLIEEVRGSTATSTSPRPRRAALDRAARRARARRVGRPRVSDRRRLRRGRDLQPGRGSPAPRSSPVRPSHRCGSTIPADAREARCGRASSLACCRSASITSRTGSSTLNSWRSPMCTCRRTAGLSWRNRRGWRSSRDAISGVSRGSSRVMARLHVEAPLVTPRRNPPVRTGSGRRAAPG